MSDFDYSFSAPDKDGIRWAEVHHEGKVVTSVPARDSDTAIRWAKEMIEWLAWHDLDRVRRELNSLPVRYGDNAAEPVLDLIERMLDSGDITRDQAEVLCLEFSINPGRLVEP